MGTLIYATSLSIDGYVADADGDFLWSAPSDEVFAVHVDRMSTVSAEVLGRKTYQLMTYWEKPPEGVTWSEAEHEFARRWRGIDRVVVSSTLAESDIVSDGTRLVPRITLSDLSDLVDAAPGVVEIFGPTVAAEAITAGLVDEYHLFVVPRLVGGGLRALPDGAQQAVHLREHRIFDDGTAMLRYTRA